MNKNQIKVIKGVFMTLFVVAFLGCISSPFSGQESYMRFYEKHRHNTDGFRLPKGDDFSYWGKNVDTFFYKSTDDEGREKAPYWTKGDFNLDGVIDWVYLLFNEGNDSAAVFVFLSQPGGEYRVVEVAPATKYMGVSTDVFKDSDREVHLIKLFEFEGHATLYIWDSSEDGFRRQI